MDLHVVLIMCFLIVSRYAFAGACVVPALTVEYCCRNSLQVAVPELAATNVETNLKFPLVLSTDRLRPRIGSVVPPTLATGSQNPLAKPVEPSQSSAVSSSLHYTSTLPPPQSSPFTINLTLFYHRGDTIWLFGSPIWPSPVGHSLFQPNPIHFFV